MLKPNKGFDRKNTVGFFHSVQHFSQLYFYAQQGVMLLEDNSDHEYIDNFFWGLNIYGWSNTHC